MKARFGAAIKEKIKERGPSRRGAAPFRCSLVSAAGAGDRALADRGGAARPAGGPCRPAAVAAGDPEPYPAAAVAAGRVAFLDRGWPFSFSSTIPPADRKSGV